MQRKQDLYENYVKRLLDVICSLLVIVFFWWGYVIIAVIVRCKLGSPIIFKQLRPGRFDSNTGKERIFKLYKFRTMTDDRDQSGELLPDNERMTPFGYWLRRSSLDETLEIFNILKGDMSLVGPRPLLVRDMVFMTDKQRMRHTKRPGLSGLAQVMGRNAITWEEKLNLDLQYIERISFFSDLNILWMTVKKVLGRSESSQELEITDDYGDYLLKAGKVSKEKYDTLQTYANSLIAKNERRN